MFSRQMSLKLNSHAAFPGGYDNKIRLWDPRTRARVGELLGHKDYVYAAKFSTDGMWLVSCSADCTW